MTNTAFRATALALHQLTVTLGIVLLPVALLAQRLGIRLPIRRLLEATERTYRRASER